MIFVAFKEHQNNRLDIFLQSCLKKFSRTKIKNIINDGCVKINNLTIDEPSKKVKEKDRVEIKIPEEKEIKIQAQKINIDILYEDKDIILINKPAGIIVHPGTKNPKHTLLNGILNDFPEIKYVGNPERPGIVHRLDKETSGILIVARNNRSFESLSNMFKSRNLIIVQ